jgi:hypothetical protein
MLTCTRGHVGVPLETPSLHDQTYKTIRNNCEEQTSVESRQNVRQGMVRENTRIVPVPWAWGCSRPLVCTSEALLLSCDRVLLEGQVRTTGCSPLTDIPWNFWRSPSAVTASSPGQWGQRHQCIDFIICTLLQALDHST